MDIVMFHSGDAFPSFLEDNFRQIRLFNPVVTIYFLTDIQYLNNPIFKKYNITVLNKDSFYSSKISRFEICFKYRHKSNMYQFWVYTAIRLIFIENFIKTYKLNSVYHFENDILLYYNLSEFHKIFLKLYPHMSITVGGQDKCMTGFMFIRDGQSLSEMTQFFIDILEKYGKGRLMKIYNMDMVNEMTLMRAYSKDYPDKLMLLPILPFGEFSKGYDEFISVFDPASYGMFVGGSAQEKEPGCKPQDHYIGQLLREHPEYDVVWKVDDRNRKVPYFKYDGQEVKINNLHIHSKNLSLYMS